jgi:RNA polymerase sigma factor (sigma-70 family)
MPPADRPDDDGAAIARLVVGARGGDRAALDAIVERCTPMLQSVARRYLHSPADVEDVVQDVWLTFVENIGRIRTPAATRGWLVTVATHAAWRAQRRASRAAPVADVDQWWADDDTEATGLDRAYGQELRQPLAAALGQLRPGDRRLLELLAAGDRPDYRAISQELGRPVGSIGPTRQRVFERLRRQPALEQLLTV